MKNICILIPAYNPDERLLYLFEQLKESLPQSPVIIVNDGSFSDTVFKKLQKMCPPPDIIITHPKNLGKGAALKSGFKYIIDNYSSCKGVITADCDLQHCCEDISKLALALENDERYLYLGSRFTDTAKVPFKSIFGNTFASLLLKFVHKMKIKDTQTGLRAIPLSFLKYLVENNSSDFSFETYSLIKAKKLNIPIKEIPIRTIYIDKNKDSNFKPVYDSYRICKTIFGRCE